MKRLSYRLCWACALIVFSVPAAGADPFSDPIDFALHFSRLETGLDDGQQTVDTTEKQLGITAFNLVNPALQPGLLLGYAFIDIADQPLTAGMELDGFYIGPALRSTLIDDHDFTLSITGSYLYQSTRGSADTQVINLDWYQPQLDLDARWRLSQNAKLTIGGQIGRVDVNERFEGPVKQTLKLKQTSTLGGHAGMEFDLGDPGQIGVLIHHAISNGVELYFQQQF